MNKIDLADRTAVVTGAARVASYPYSTSKAAVTGMTRSMGKDIARSGVIVNCITPAAADTNILDGVDPALVKSMIDQVSMGGFVEVSELAAMVA